MTTRIIFDGSEVPSNRKILESMPQVTRFGFSYSLHKSRKPGKDWTIDQYFPEGSQVYVYPGKPGEDIPEFAADYHDFIVRNWDRITAFCEVENPLDKSWQYQERASYPNDVLDKLWVVYDGHERLQDLAARFKHIAIPHSVIEAKTTLAGLTRTLVRQGVEFHALGSSSPDNLRSIPFSTAGTLVWLTPMRRGETVVWEGSKLARYPKGMKEQARRRAFPIVRAAGLDFDKILEDDDRETARLAIWSLLLMEVHMDKTHLNRPFLTVIPGGSDTPTEDVVTNIQTPVPPDLTEIVFPDPDNTNAEVSTDVDSYAPDKSVISARGVTPRDPKDVRTIPSMGLNTQNVLDTNEQGLQTFREVQVVASSKTSARQCDSCYVASNCPAFQPGSTCAFNFPVEVRTKEQVRALLNAIIEMQSQRIAFAAYAEELNGGYPDQNTGQEIDRLFKLMKTMKDLESESQMARITVERSSSGVLSALFGERAQSLGQLPNGGIPADTVNRLIDGRDL